MTFNSLFFAQMNMNGCGILHVCIIPTARNLYLVVMLTYLHGIGTDEGGFLLPLILTGFPVYFLLSPDECRYGTEDLSANFVFSVTGRGVTTLLSHT